MNDSIKNFGALPSPPDPRDFTPNDLLGKAVPTPPAYSTDISMVPVYMQNSQPACGGHAGATIIGSLAGLGTNLSPRFVYALCKKIDGLPNQQGTTARAIFQVLQKYGVCTNDLFPNDTTLPYAEYSDWTKIPNAAFVDALSHRIGPYAQIPKPTFQSVKDNIFQHKVVLILGKIGNEWWTPSWKASDILPLRPPAQVVSGHFWVNFSFDQLNTYLRNSFGPAWGVGGNGDYENNYTPFITEAWVADLPPAPPVQTLTPAQNLQQQISLYQKVVQLLQAWIKQLTTTQ